MGNYISSRQVWRRGFRGGEIPCERMTRLTAAENCISRGRRGLPFSIAAETLAASLALEAGATVAGFGTVESWQQAGTDAGLWRGAFWPGGQQRCEGCAPGEHRSLGPVHSRTNAASKM